MLTQDPPGPEEEPTAKVDLLFCDFVSLAVFMPRRSSESGVLSWQYPIHCSPVTHRHFYIECSILVSTCLLADDH